MLKFEEDILKDLRTRLKILTDIPISLEFLNGIEYGEANYSSIKAILEDRNIFEIKSLSSDGNSGLSDNLLIYLLKQNNELDRIVVILDKFDAWSDPFVLEIF